MGRVSHHGILLLGPGAQEDPGLVLDVENPQLAGHVSCGVDLSSVHVDLPLEETNSRAELDYIERSLPKLNKHEQNKKYLVIFIA